MMTMVIDTNIARPVSHNDKEKTWRAVKLTLTEPVGTGIDLCAIIFFIHGDFDEKQCHHQQRY